MMVTPEEYCQPAEGSGDCSDCSSGCVAAHPRIDLVQVNVLVLRSD